MKYAVGYQLSEEYEQEFIDIVRTYKDHISEVYFPWIDNSTGRGSLADDKGYFDWTVQNKLVSDLREIKKMNIKLDLLFNGNCYGEDAISMNLANHVSSIIDYLDYEGCSVEIITTTSPMIAHVIKSQYPSIEVRASVNMRIGTVKGMQYMAHLFDSFYVQRDYNRNLEKIEELKQWADNNHKKLFMLANSGCMSFCSCQTFHDNMVSHNSAIYRQQNIKGFNFYACWTYLKDKKNWSSILQNTWIRPEDICHYEKYFTTVKLATRMHQLPALVIGSYVRQKYYGNLLNLFEPGFGPALAPYVIENSRFPKDWFEVTSKCNKKCHLCNYCEEVLKQVLICTE